MKQLLLLLFILASISAFSQPVVTKLENFPIGWKLIFRNCNTAGVNAGKKGVNQTWDFSNLSLKPDSTVEWMVDPSTTPKGSDFPTANLVEKYSNGQYVYVNKTTNNNYMVGYYNGTTEISYPKPILFVQRPEHYNDSIQNTFIDHFTSSGYDFKGTGSIKIIADGYGTLKLPNGTYNNVLRLKITQQQTDTIVQSGFVTGSSTTTYIWCDDLHYSALLKIDSSSIGTSVVKNVQFLLDENMSAIDNTKPAGFFSLTGFIYNQRLSVRAQLIAGKKYEVRLYDLEGKNLFNSSFSAKADDLYSFPVHNTNPGIYIIELIGNNDRHFAKILSK
jgi:hypothetical protein